MPWGVLAACSDNFGHLPMRIIDRYLLRQFVQVFLICFLSLAGLFVVLDAFSNLDEFFKYTDSTGSMVGMMGEYYAFRTLKVFEQLGGVLALVAAMFTVTWIQRHNELTALMAAGISRMRVVTPVIVAAAAISLISATARELVIPNFRAQLSRSARDLQGDQAQKLQPREDHRTYIILGGSQTFGNEQRIQDANFLLPRELDQWGPQLVAANAYYRSPEADRPGGYLLKGVTQPVDIAARESLSLEGERVVITSRDEPDWLAADECFVVSDITFEQLTGGQSWRQFSSTAELIRGLRNPSLDFGADVRVAIHTRFVQPLLDVTLLFLGLPLVLTRENRNVFMAIGMCLLLVLLFLVVVLAGQYLGTVYLVSPALAVWLPLMIFVPIAVYMYEQVRQ